MKLFILPGNSPQNKEWVEKLKEGLAEKVNEVYIQYYDHWQTGEEIINLGRELEKLIKEINLQQYLLLGKSAGVLVILKGIFENKLKPKACIFLGTPIFWARALNFSIDEYLKNFQTPTIFIHQSEDPAISANDLQELLLILKVKNYKFITIPGNDHSYNDFTLISHYIFQFIKPYLN
jgi:predicted esterase